MKKSKMEKQNMEEFYKREWKDAERILKLNRLELLWEIYAERSNKLNIGMLGFLIGLLIGLIVRIIIHGLIK